MKKGRIFGILAVFATLFATPVIAQSEQAIALSGDVKVVKTITDENGAERIELADTSVVIPGDRLLFSTSFRNQSAAPVENFMLTNPLSSAVAMASDTAADQDVSVDGGQTWGKLADLTITAEDGTVRAAQAEDVTHLRWLLKRIEPGETGEITFYAIVR